MLLFVLGQACAPAPSSGPETDAGAHALVLISFDGYRWDYPELVDTPNLDRLIARGVRAESMIPPYPSKTFPAHYTLVTGLHPGHHGIISNNMRDPRWPEPFGLGLREEVEKQRWWGGEPIWATAQRQGLRSGVYFWPGSESPAGGQQPTHWRRFDATVPFEARVDQALEWLDLPGDDAVRLVAMYFGEPNDSGHRHGPLADETVAAVGRVDDALGRLLDGLQERGRLETTDIVVVSDHGMAQMDIERVILLDDLVELREHEVFDQGAILQLFPDEGREEEIFAALQGAHPNLRVFRRGDLPDELHLYDSPRVPPILGIPDVGWEVMTRGRLDWAGGRVIAGDHGQDPSHPDMRAVFVAAGPSFAGGITVPPIESVDVYNLLAASLGIEPAANDGSAERVEGILR